MADRVLGTEMVAAATQDFSGAGYLCQHLGVDQGSTGHGSGTKSRCANIKRTAGVKRWNWNQ
jgi:hypothetical protein